MQTAGPSHTIAISGTDPGQLDPSQRSRLLSSPGSRLTFAAFNPKTASADSRRPSAKDELCSQKRVVIEILPTGENFWRWVPRAKGVESASGEGSWPRIINICGQLVECTQDQWDIYKLDPVYECVVRPQPDISTITRRDIKQSSITPDETIADSYAQKRRVNGDHEQPLPPAKKRRPIDVDEVQDEGNANEDTDSDEEDAVEEMIIDDSMPGAWTQKKREYQGKTQKERAKRREKTAARAKKVAESKASKDASDLSMIDLTLDESDDETPTQSGTSGSSQPSTTFSQASTTQSQSSAPSSVPSTTPLTTSSDVPIFFKRPAESPETNGGTSKRTRTRSPSPTFSKRYDPELKDVYQRRRQQQQKTRQERIRQRTMAQRDAQQRAFEDALRASAKAAFFPSFSESSGRTPSVRSSSSRTPSQPAPEIVDPVSLEEKIRRMAEINAFEEARVAKELERLKVEQAAEERRRKQEEERIREKVRLEREAREREIELERQRQRLKEEQEKRKREQEHEELKRRIQQQQDRWAYGPWTTQRALERYKLLSETFDSMQFSPESPLSFITVPWPVLHRPASLTIEDVDWGAVEAFFKAIRTHMRTQDYKALVEKSHRRFHPDRWRARRVLQSVQDEELRACLEVAANTVAQALTPIWRDAKGA